MKKWSFKWKKKPNVGIMGGVNQKIRWKIKPTFSLEVRKGKENPAESIGWKPRRKKEKWIKKRTQITPNRSLQNPEKHEYPDER